MTAPASPAPIKPASAWEDFVDVFFSPAELFRRRADGRFGLALVVFFLLSAGLFFATRSAMTPIFDAEWHRATATLLKANPGLTADQIASGRKMAATFGVVFFVIGAPLGALVLGTVVWSVGKAMSGALRYAQGLTIATFALFPRLVEALVNALEASFLDERSITSRYSISLGVGRFLDVDHTNPFLVALLGRLDLFTIWVTVLIGIGLKVVAKIPGAQAAVAAITIWFVGAIPALYQAYRAM